MTSLVWTALLAGTGYLTACFAVMVGSEGRAVGIEHIPELVTWSIENIKKSKAASLLEEGSLSVHVGGKISNCSHISLQLYNVCFFLAYLFICYSFRDIIGDRWKARIS